jgi:hypothetical protein
MAEPAAPLLKGIKDVFYETRVLMGRQYTVRRFAAEVLDGTVEPVTLGAIEKGTRFPNEALVRRLAAIRKQDPKELLALLWRDRMLYAFGRELRRVLRAPGGAEGIENADLAVLVSQAIAALPEDDRWMPLADWHTALRTLPSRPGQAAEVSDALLTQVETLLSDRKLIELKDAEVRRRGYHFIAQGAEERQGLILEFFALFAKGVLDKLVLPEAGTETYLRNHYLYIDPARLFEFQRRLDESLVKLADEFAADSPSGNRFLNVLVTSTPF